MATTRLWSHFTLAVLFTIGPSHRYRSSMLGSIFIWLMSIWHYSCRHLEARHVCHKMMFFSQSNRQSNVLTMDWKQSKGTFLNVMLVTSCMSFYKLIQQHFIVMPNPRSSPVTSWFVSTVVISGALWTEKWQNENFCSSNLLWKCTGGLTVGLLVAGAGSRSTELLGLAATWVGDQQGPVVLDQDVLDLFLGSLIHICNTSEVRLP